MRILYCSISSQHMQMTHNHRVSETTTSLLSPVLKSWRLCSEAQKWAFGVTVQAPAFPPTQHTYTHRQVSPSHAFQNCLTLSSCLAPRLWYRCEKAHWRWRAGHHPARYYHEDQEALKFFNTFHLQSMWLINNCCELLQWAWSCGKKYKYVQILKLAPHLNQLGIKGKASIKTHNVT